MRRQLLENIREILKNKILKEEYIFINRGFDSDIEELPIINIVSVSEEVSIFDRGPKSYRRRFLINIECFAAGNDYSEAWKIMEDMVSRVEAIMEGDSVMNGIDRETFLERITFDFDGESRLPVASAIMEYGAEEVRRAEEDETDLESLNTINIQYKIKDNTSENEVDAEDTFEDLNT